MAEASILKCWSALTGAVMKAISAVTLLSAILCSCTSRYAGNDANIYSSLNGQKVVGNDQYVTVSNVWNEMDALPLADAHCKQYGKSARFNHTEPFRAIFGSVSV
jgi:hypothetical protein